MSEQSAEATATESEGSTTEPTQQTGEQQPKPTETVEFWREQAKKQEKRAKENADAAKRLSEIEESQKSESEKSADRIKGLESELSSTRTSAFKEAVVRFGGIDQEDADLFLTASDPETLNKQLERLVARSGERIKNGNHVPTEGTTPKPGEATDANFARNLFSGD